jgi:hypothetical protein
MLDRRSFMLAAPAALAFTVATISNGGTMAVAQDTTAVSVGPQVTGAVVAAAERFLGSLSAEQQQQVVYEAGDAALRDWFYFPSRRDRSGIAFEDLSAAQAEAAFGVVQAVLSREGYAQFRGILAAEQELGVRNGEPHVNSGRYFIAFFGSPSASGRFTVQVNGHHLAINTTYEGGRVSPSPAFTGTDPVEIELDGRRVRPMGRKTEAYSQLLGGMSEAELAAAQIGPIDDVRVGTGATEQYPRSQGALVSELGARQQELVANVVRAWVGDANEEVAEQLMAIYQSEFGSTRLAWAVTADPDARGAYLRLDGPRLWIEFCNVGRFGNGDNHYHSVFRDKVADYLR